MATYERYVTWYSPWPLLEAPTFDDQVRTMRWDTIEAGSVLRSALLEIDDSAPYYQSEKWLKGLNFGTYNPANHFLGRPATTKNRFRVRCSYEDSSSFPGVTKFDHLYFQVNTGTDASPTWVTAFKIEPTLGQVTFGEGGARSIGGWYG